MKDGRTLGRLTIMLFSDVVPVTVKNFMQLILNHKRQNEADRKGRHGKFPHYVGSPIHRYKKNDNTGRFPRHFLWDLVVACLQKYLKKRLCAAPSNIYICITPRCLSVRQFVCEFKQ